MSSDTSKTIPEVLSRLDQSQATPCDFATAYVEAGIPIIPVHTVRDGMCSCGSPACGSPGKHPTPARGLHDAFTDRNTVEVIWGDNPDLNIGIITGKKSGVWVLDIDAGKDGFDSLEKLIQEHGPLPDTLSVHTGGGGQHLFFLMPEEGDVRNRTNIRPGIDVRGTGGYVVAPPSVHISGGKYSWENLSGLEPAPTWIIDAMSPEIPPVEHDVWPEALCINNGIEHSINRARLYINEMPPAFSGDGGHNQTFSVACVLVLGFSLPPPQALALLREYNLRCEPPWSEKELQHKIEDADKKPGPRGYLLDRTSTKKKTIKSTRKTRQGGSPGSGSEETTIVPKRSVSKTSIKKTSAKKKSGTNSTNPTGKSPSVIRNSPNYERIKKTVEKLTSRNRTDSIQIGSGDAGNADDDMEGTTLADAAEMVGSVKYLVPDYIPFGMVTGVVAEPGIGKSAFVLYALVRLIVKGDEQWFNETAAPGQPEKVLWLDTENGMAITIDRVTTWDIPMKRIILPFKDDPLRSVNLADSEHLELIEQLINRHQPPLVVLDSLRGSHSGDENNSRVAEVLKRLSKIAERTGAAVVVVHHTRKPQSGEEISANSCRGSNAIVATFRSLLGIDKPDPKSKWCRLRVLKENLGIAPPPMGFLVTKEGVEFGETPAAPSKQTEKDRATEWLKENIAPGERLKSAELLEKADQDGFSGSSIKRAKKPLSIVSEKVDKEWMWYRPETP